MLGCSRRIPRDVLLAEVELFTTSGESALALADRLDLQPGSIARALHRAGRHDLAARFNAEQLRARVAAAGLVCLDCPAPISLYHQRCPSCAAHQRAREAAARRLTHSTQKAA